VSGGRLEHALAAFLRQEFGASVAAIIGFLDILIEDAHRPDLADYLADLQRMREAGAQLSALIARAVDTARGDDAETARLRHELRTPLNAIKGYGELLVEEARESGRDTLLSDLGNVLDLADRLLEEIDRIGEAAAPPPIDIISNVLQTIRPLGEVDLRDPSAASSQILVVDDNSSNRDLLSRRLVREGYRVTVASGGAAALADRCRGLRSRAARSDDAGDERVRGALPAQGRRAHAAHSGHHDLGARRARQYGPLHRSRGGGLPAQAVQSGRATCAHRRVR
jgi:adenylate cyclase